MHSPTGSTGGWSPSKSRATMSPTRPRISGYAGHVPGSAFATGTPKPMESQMGSLGLGDAVTSAWPNPFNPVEASPADVATACRSRCGAVLARNQVLKGDHFPSCLNKSLPEAIPGAPNFRQARRPTCCTSPSIAPKTCSRLDAASPNPNQAPPPTAWQVAAAPVYGVGQPSVDGARRASGCSAGIRARGARSHANMHLPSRVPSLPTTGHISAAVWLQGACGARAIGRQARQAAVGEHAGGAVRLHRRQAGASPSRARFLASAGKRLSTVLGRMDGIAVNTARLRCSSA